MTFLEELREQRWDDHRFYHQSRVNQSLHLLSGCCFLATYVLIPIDPVAAAFFGWVIAMWVRQIGHVFFEKRDFDQINKVTFKHKEEVKVGFNLRRKLILFVSWLSVPVLLKVWPGAIDLLEPYTHTKDYSYNLAIVWLGLAAVGLVGRTLFLCATRSLQTGVVWFVKILTDPFNDIKMYHKAPLALMRGEWFDPMADVQSEH